MRKFNSFLCHAACVAMAFFTMSCSDSDTPEQVSVKAVSVAHEMHLSSDMLSVADVKVTYTETDGGQPVTFTMTDVDWTKSFNVTKYPATLVIKYEFDLKPTADKGSTYDFMVTGRLNVQPQLTDGTVGGDYIKSFYFNNKGVSGSNLEAYFARLSDIYYQIVIDKDGKSVNLIDGATE